MRLMNPWEAFEQELKSLINRHGMERHIGNTPDYLITAHVMQSLMTLAGTISRRTVWYARRTVGYDGGERTAQEDSVPVPESHPECPEPRQ